MGQGVATLLEQLDHHYLAPNGSFATKFEYLDLVHVVTWTHPFLPVTLLLLCFYFVKGSNCGLRSSQCFFFLPLFFLSLLWTLKVLWVWKHKKRWLEKDCNIWKVLSMFANSNISFVLSFVFLFWSFPLWEAIISFRCLTFDMEGDGQGDIPFDVPNDCIH